jgi:hypothetical protein
MMLKWVEAKKKLGLRRDYELLKLFPGGLQPYSCTDVGVEKIGCPYEYHLHGVKFNERRRKIKELSREKNSSSPDKKNTDL